MSIATVGHGHMNGCYMAFSMHHWIGSNCIRTPLAFMKVLQKMTQAPFFFYSVQYSILRGIHAKNIIKDVFLVVWKWTWDRWLIKTKKLIKNCFPHQPDVYVIDITITTQCILEQLKKCRTIDNHKQETVKCREIQIWCYKSEHPPPRPSLKKNSLLF